MKVLVKPRKPVERIPKIGEVFATIGNGEAFIRIPTPHYSEHINDSTFYAGMCLSTGEVRCAFSGPRQILRLVGEAKFEPETEEN